ncbi:MAG: hypothetical protein C3F07_20545 [Anaerolineales bacterium]|nr:hypothetical protein [Anaerolineae bacterium]PWB69008.1 MAG: hypothetical protein C3F07_20545 [Anaerolineales bacterium]
MTNSENNSLFKQPSAWIPLAMSFVALAMIVVFVAINGFASSGNGDEGAPARIFQFIMVAQLPIAGYFAVKWLPKQPKQSLMVLALQAVAWIIPIVTIIYLESL